MLQAGVHPKVVQERLGHSSITVTMDTHSHAIPSLQEDAADRVADLLYIADGKATSDDAKFHGRGGGSAHCQWGNLRLAHHMFGWLVEGWGDTERSR